MLTVNSTHVINPGTVRSSATKLGDDTDAVLGEIGFSPKDIAALRGRKVAA